MEAVVGRLQLDTSNRSEVGGNVGMTDADLARLLEVTVRNVQLSYEDEVAGQTVSGTLTIPNIEKLELSVALRSTSGDRNNLL